MLFLHHHLYKSGGLSDLILYLANIINAHLIAFVLQNLPALLFAAALVIAFTVLTVMLTNWLLKVTWEVVLTPVTYAVVGWLKNREGVDVFDTGIEFSPFAKTESV